MVRTGVLKAMAVVSAVSVYMTIGGELPLLRVTCEGSKLAASTVSLNVSSS